MKEDYRKRQREVKASERAVQRELIERLDGLVPLAEVKGRALNGTLKSGRTTVQLYEDCVCHCKKLQDPRAGGHARRAEARSVSGAELMEAVLSSNSERVLVVDLPEWTVVGMSSSLRQDFAGAAFGNDLVSSCCAGELENAAHG
eukprot:765308-Hanusia_phi.AAC.3